MQFEEYDNRIKEAADNHHPAYDEQAWAKMERLLDAHLPDKMKKEQKKVFPFLFFILLGILGIFIGKPDRTGENIKTMEKATASIPTSKNEQMPSQEIAAIQNDNPFSAVKNADSISKGMMISNEYILTNSRKFKNNMTNIDSEIQPVVRIVHHENNIVKKDKNVVTLNQQNDSLVFNVSSHLIPKSEEISSGLVTGNETNQHSEFVKKLTSDTVASAFKKSQVSTKRNKNSGTKKKFARNFIVSISGGMDISFTSIGKPGKIRTSVGMGLGYKINQKLTVRSGFFTASKIYSASPKAYNPPGNFYTYYPYLENVNADCRILEIPVQLSYNLKAINGYIPFVSTGLSSLFMKRETYNYFYKNSISGPTLNRAYTIKNANKHIMSVLTISGGVQKEVNSKFSFMAEPYIKIPLVGIGYGHVKLNSVGVLFSVGYKPFSNHHLK